MEEDATEIKIRMERRGDKNEWMYEEHTKDEERQEREKKREERKVEWLE